MKKTALSIYHLIIGKPIRAIFIFRLSSLFYRLRFKLIGQLFWNLNIILHSIEISPLAKIGERLKIAHTIGIVIGGGVVIGNDVKLYQNVTLGGKKNHKTNKMEYPTIEDDVTIYTGAVVMGNITIGKGAIIGANSVVNKDVLPHSIVAGNPARRIVKDNSNLE